MQSFYFLFIFSFFILTRNHSPQEPVITGLNVPRAGSETSKVPGGLDLLLLRPDLDGLLVDELLQLVLRGDQLVVLHGARLGGHGVEDGGHGLAADDGGGQRGGGLHQLGLM